MSKDTPRSPTQRSDECGLCTLDGAPCDMYAAKLNKSFGDNRVLHDFSLAVKRGETFCIIGRSGCGKSVFLKHVIGLLEPDSGTMCVFGQDISTLSPKERELLHRRVGMVFQGAALLASLTVYENIALGLEEKGMSAENIRDVVPEKLALVNMQDTEHLYPAELSGGMKKRAAVARTLAMEPEMILFDEPTTGQDPVTCDDIDDMLIELKEDVGVTSIIVTHDLTTAFAVADRVGMMHNGQIVEIGSPQDIQASENAIVRQFIARTCEREESRA